MAKKELDRFDTNAKKALSLSFRITVLTGLGILLTGVVVALVSMTVFYKGYVNEIEDQIEMQRKLGDRLSQEPPRIHHPYSVFIKHTAVFVPLGVVICIWDIGMLIAVRQSVLAVI